MIGRLVLGVISDLHVGQAARASDLRPDRDKTGCIEDDYVEQFLTFLDESALKLDYLLLPGDMSHQAVPNEFALASTIVKRIATKLDLPIDRILFVPGNHDVNWTVLKDATEDTTGVFSGLRYAPLTNQELPFFLPANRGKGNLLGKPYVSCWERPEIVVLGYNSSWHDN